MLVTWGTLAGLLLYLEMIYHISCFGLSGCNPIYMLFVILVWSAAGTLFVGSLRGRLKKFVFYFCLWFPTIWACVQVVYLRIFKQPLLWEAIFRGGGDALTNYWREALHGILTALPILLVLVMPAVGISFLLLFKRWTFPVFSQLQGLRWTVVLALGIVGCVTTLQVGKIAELDYYEDYREFFDPMTVAENMGMWTMLERDTVLSTKRTVLAAWNGQEQQIVPAYKEETPIEEEVSTNQSDISGEEVLRLHEFVLDFETLRALADNDKQMWLAEYIEGLVPQAANEYTGIFEGYNLIYLTAEGFSTYAIREDLTPTLYRLTHSGFVFENYYVPLWQTSTSDGEYINCTGLIPDGQFSMRKSAENEMPFTLPGFFEGEGVASNAYHNNSLSYYDRYLTHPNLGYDFKGCKPGNLKEEEWEDNIFPMENPNAWPASDLEMMQGTVTEYINDERFHVYYLTVSGHMNYDFKGNAMSGKNKEAVAHLDMSENARAYIACNIELDKALEYLLAELAAAGQLEKTVICLSADHYPYAMTTEQYEELAGKTLEEDMDMYRNSLILWNAAMEEKSVVIDKACGSMDIVPTLLNLFGFSYDSRMYAGRDMLSDEEGMVIFNDRSFVTDGVIYKRKAKEIIWLKDEEGNDIIPDEAKEEYLANKKQEVKERYQFSAYILQENYYKDILQVIEEE